MSEYQYYEYLAIDRPLTDAQMRELRSISSRAEITPTHFSNEYNYGDLKADPAGILQKYFDVHVYVANWGTRRLGLRLPADVVDLEELQPYCASEQSSVECHGDYVIFDMWSDTEDFEGWVEGAGWMASLAQVREQLLKGDLRAAYLAWLLAVQNEELEADDAEPYVPAGLAHRSAPLQSLADFLRLDGHLVEAAAEGSDSERDKPRELGKWIAALPSDEKDALLLDTIRGEGRHVGLKLLRRFRSEGSNGARAKSPNSARRVGELIERADALREAYEAEQAREAERERRRCEKAAAAARKKRLDQLEKRQTAAWSQVEELVSSKKPKAYDEAVLLLTDLRDLSDRQGDLEAFTRRFASLRARHERKPSFIARLERAGLLAETPPPSASDASSLRGSLT